MSEQPNNPTGAPDPMQTVKAASRDAARTFMSLVYNPVGALPSSYQALPESQALAVGVVFMVVWLLWSLVGASMGVSGLGLPYLGSIGDLPFGYKLRGLIVMLSFREFEYRVAGFEIVARHQTGGFELG